MQPTENYIKKLHPHPIAFLGFYIGGIIFLILGFFLLKVFTVWIGLSCMVLGIIIFCLGEIMRRAETFYILDSGIERGFKLLSSSRDFISYEKIQDLQVDQGIFQSMFGIGNLNFDTAGTNQIEIHFYAVKDPYSLEKIVRDKISNIVSNSHP